MALNVDLNVTLTLIIYDPDVSQTRIVDTIDDTTSSYLDLLSATYEYNLTVAVIENKDGILTVSVVVLSDDEQINLNEAEVIDECDKEIDEQYGDKVDLKNPNAAEIPKDAGIEVNFEIKYEHLLYGVVGLSLMLICCGCALVATCTELRRKSKETITPGGNLPLDTLIQTHIQKVQSMSHEYDTDFKARDSNVPAKDEEDDEDLYSVPTHLTPDSMTQTATAVMRCASMTSM